MNKYVFTGAMLAILGILFLGQPDTYAAENGQVYDDANTFAKDRQFTIGIDAYMRKAYSMILKILS